MQTGFVREGQPEWGKHAMLVTGWLREEQDLTSELALHLQKAVMRVHRTLTRIALEGQWKDSWLSRGKPGPLRLTPTVIKKA